MAFNPAEAYTNKSQYLLHASLSGSNNANLTGNEQNNRLAGNEGNNILDGLAGEDTVFYPNRKDAYEIKQNSDGSITAIGDNIDTLLNIEDIVFADYTLLLEE
jgi:Ca2+-binding RTX toxin-like protein